MLDLVVVPAVVQGGQGIGEAERENLMLFFPLLSAVAEDQHHSGDVHFGIEDGGSTVINVPFEAVAGYEDGVLFQFNGMLYSKNLFYRIGACRSVLAVQDLEDFLESPSFRFLCIPAGKYLCCLVHELNIAVCIGAYYSVTDGEQGSLKEVLLINELCLGFFLVGDVVDDHHKIAVSWTERGDPEEPAQAGIVRIEDH